MRRLRLAEFRVSGARIFLLSLLGILLAGASMQRAITPPTRDPALGIGDTNLQLLTIDRIRQGESYYQAVGDELRRNAYPTRPLINWRTPLHYTFVAALSVERAGTVLSVLAMLAFVTGALAYARQSAVRALMGGLFLLAAMAPAMLVRPGAVVFPETWAGVFVALSLNAYIAGLWVPAAVLGVLAVFVRELVAPYALVCGVLALKARRRHEAIVWIAGGASYALYYGLHATAAMGAVQPGDLVREQSYMQLLGLEFVFKTLYTYGGLAILPAAVTPVAAALGLMAAWAPSAPPQLAVPLLVYFVLLCAVGQPFNYYWGFFTCVIWAHAFVHSSEGGARLLCVAAGRSKSKTSREPAAPA